MKKYTSILLSAVVIILSLLFCKIQKTSSDNIILNEMPVIIIDAGHGGEDGGAVADDGTLEKDLNLDIALKLNNILSVMGYKTYLIRTTDTAIHTSGDTIRQRKISDIKNRFAIMNKYDNCLYISIHQNKFNDKSVHGAQTFYSPNNNESKVLADFVQKSISSQLQTENKRLIKKSGTDIYILYNATKPTIMVECGFVSNDNELKKLKDSVYQNKMAISIAFGIINYNVSEVKNGSEI
ncbi:MAG: N-acetylmuramoyl-L-alanine amidase [Clostridia bacterium]|nr:N-acetylmuramoyl-L-alanine amidase [Clostridia bacterium]